MTMAVNMEVSTPIARVTENPVTAELAEPLPNKNRIPAMIKVEIFPSRMDCQARLNPIWEANCRDLPMRNSSFIRSNMRILASTAIPRERTKAANPASVNVTGNILKIANTMAV